MAVADGFPWRKWPEFPLEEIPIGTVKDNPPKNMQKCYWFSLGTNKNRCMAAASTSVGIEPTYSDQVNLSQMLEGEGFGFMVAN